MAFVYILVAVLALLFMITVHELGHYLAAKILKFPVKEFAIGFGKPLFKHTSKKTGEIFSIRVFPLGGFCAFEGEDAAGSPGAEKTALREGVVSYEKQAPWKRIIVLAAGGIFNIICGIFFSFILLMVVGYYQRVDITKVDDAPHNAGLLKGDIVREVNGERFTWLNNYSTAVAPFAIGEKFTLTVTHTEGVNKGKTEKIVVSKEEMVNEKGEKYYAVGLSGSISFEKASFGLAAGKAFVFSAELAWMVLRALFMLLTFQLPLSQMGGTFSTISVMSQAISVDMMNLLVLIPLISINLGVFNLLPIPALDGARMVFCGIEWVRKKPVDPALEGRIHMIGMFILFAFIILLDFNYLVLQRFL